eukprot:m.250317 g.250317  ORF g.250317 m.250317 type:complete len:815 (+) comp40317_c1_seq2:901-3345(+)
MLADEALTQLHDVVSQLQLLPIAEDIDGLPYAWNVGLDVQKILAKALLPKIIQLGKTLPVDDEAATERLVSAIAIAVVIKRYRLTIGNQLSIGDFKSLTSAFSLQSDLSKQSCPSLEALSDNFSDSKMVFDAVYNVCCQLWEKERLVAEWITAIPLFHFLANLNRPFKLPCIHVDWRKNDWWGLGNSESRLPLFPASLLDIKERLLPLFSLDPLLLRFVLFVSRLKDLKEWIAVTILPSEGIIAIAKRAEMLTQVEKSPNPTLMAVLRKTLARLAERVLDMKTEPDSCLEETFESVMSGIEASLHLLSVLCMSCISREQSVVCDIITIVVNYFEVFDRMRVSGFIFPSEQPPPSARFLAQWIDSTSDSVAETATFCTDIKLWSSTLCEDMLKLRTAVEWCSSLTPRLKKISQQTEVDQMQKLQDDNFQLLKKCRQLSHEKKDLVSRLSVQQTFQERLVESLVVGSQEKTATDDLASSKAETIRELEHVESAKEDITKEKFSSLLREYQNLREVCQRKEKQIIKLKEYDQLLNISLEDVEMTGIEIGRGSYGVVEVGYWRGSPVAVKIFYDFLKNDHNIGLFRQEMEISARVRHPNILTTFGATTAADGTPLRMITRLLEGSLTDVIKAGSPLSLREQVDLAVGCTAGLSYLHQLVPVAVLHGDIRPSNILVTAMMEAQIADLGTARFISGSLSAGLLSSQYIAPERLEGFSSNTKAADVCSLGVTLIQLMTNKDPVLVDRPEQADMVIHPVFRDLCLRAVSDSPKQRPSAHECLVPLEGIRHTDEYKKCHLKRVVKGKFPGGRTVTLMSLTSQL